MPPEGREEEEEGVEKGVEEGEGSVFSRRPPHMAQQQAPLQRVLAKVQCGHGTDRLLLLLLLLLLLAGTGDTAWDTATAAGPEPARPRGLCPMLCPMLRPMLCPML